MKIKQSTLEKTIKNITTIAGLKTQTQNIKLTMLASSGKLELFADNPSLYHTIYDVLEVDADANFNISVDLDDFRQMLNFFDKEEMLEFNFYSVRGGVQCYHGRCDVKSDNAESSCACSEADKQAIKKHLSDEDLDKDSYTVEINGLDLNKALSSVADFIADSSQSYKSITGAYFKFETKDNKTRLTCVGTDNMVLAINQDTILDKDYGINKEFILPKKSVISLLRLLSDKTVKITIKENLVLFKTGNAVISFFTINEKYPDYTAIIPKNLPKQIKFKTNIISDAMLKLSSLIKIDEIFKITVEKDKTSIALHGSKHVQAKKEVDNITNNSDETFSLLATPYGIQRAVKSLPDAEFLLCVDESTRPFVIKTTETNLQYVIMPSLR